MKEKGGIETFWAVHGLSFSLIHKSKIHLEKQRTKMSQCTLRKTKFDDLHSPISIFFIKLQHLMWYWCKNWGKNMQIDQWSRIEIAETDSDIHGQLNYDNT